MSKSGAVPSLARVYRAVATVDEMLESFWGARIRFDNGTFKFLLSEEPPVEFESPFPKIKIRQINVHGRVNIAVKTQKNGYSVRW